MHTPLKADMAVVGAGPAGRAAAAEAVTSGLDVVLVDEGPATLPQPGMRTLPFHQVWSVTPGFRIDAIGPHGAVTIEAPRLIAATGAIERLVPFPGWTLPGVTALRDPAPEPDARVVIAGHGPLLAKAASRLAASGITIAAIANLSASTPWMTARAAQGIPVFPHHTILRAEGHTRLERVALAPVDASGAPAGEPRWFEADALHAGHGLRPASEIPRLLRAPHRFDPRLGGWVPVLDAAGRTAIPGLSVAGSAAGVAQSAEWPGLIGAIDPATIICRCEAVTRATIDAAVAVGAREVNQLKHFTRCGMGACQGRICADTAAELVARHVGSREAAGQWTMRPPLRPIPLDALLGRFTYADIPVPQPAPL